MCSDTILNKVKFPKTSVTNIYLFYNMMNSNKLHLFVRAITEMIVVIRLNTIFGTCVDDFVKSK